MYGEVNTSTSELTGGIYGTLSNIRNRTKNNKKK